MPTAVNKQKNAKVKEKTYINFKKQARMIENGKK